MPTGYTAEVMEKGMEFKKFAMQCARAFGALVTMQDDDMPYYAKALAEAIAKHEMLTQMTPDQQDAFGAMEQGKQICECQKYLAKCKEENTRIDTMLREVEAWIPPSPDHVQMKEFMRQQLTISRHDLTWSAARLQTARAKTPQAFYQEAKDASWSSISYNRQALEDEKERIESRNKWVAQLRESLAGEPKDAK